MAISGLLVHHGNFPATVRAPKTKTASSKTTRTYKRANGTLHAGHLRRNRPEFLPHLRHFITSLSKNWGSNDRHYEVINENVGYFNILIKSRLFG
jgi:hypothetical protein